MKSVIIGIAGGSGSGKTTLAQSLHDRIGSKNAILISHDYYYKAHDDIPLSERKKLNYDHPDAFDTDLLIDQLCALKNGEAVECPTYDYTQHTRAEATIHLEPAPVIIVEGILLFVDQRLCDLFDFKIYVDTDADERILRRILRDVNERGRSLESVVNQYLTTVKPMHEAFVEPSKRKADIIVPLGGHNQPALSMLERYVRVHLLDGKEE